MTLGVKFRVAQGSAQEARMKATWIGIIVATLYPLVIAPAMAASMEDKASKEVLAAMARTSTWGHPDEAAEFQGMQEYADGDYAKAMENFREGARYADKLSQLSIGLRYLNGEGVEKDPVQAYAWVALAAERKYPLYLVTRDKIWKSLNDDQRTQAKALLDELTPEYGDAVAKVRMEHVLRMTRSQMTGSLVGYGSSSTASLTPAQFAAANNLPKWAGPMPACSGKSIDGGPITGCGDLFVEWRWNPREYFQVRDAVWFGTVKVGPLQQADAN
jgi:hypothetical protein